MIEPTFRLNLSDLDREFREIERRGKNLRPVMQALVAPLKKDIQETFRLREGPDGPWEPLAPSTLGRNTRKAAARAARRGRSAPRKPPGRILGARLRSISITIGPNYLRFVNKIPWSGAHQTGARVGRGAQLPARVHLYASRDMQALARERIAAFVARGRR